MSAVNGKFGEIRPSLITHFATVLQFLFVSVPSGVAGNATNHGKAEVVSPTLAVEVLEADVVLGAGGLRQLPLQGGCRRAKRTHKKALGGLVCILLCQTSSRETAEIFSLKT